MQVQNGKHSIDPQLETEVGGRASKGESEKNEEGGCEDEVGSMIVGDVMGTIHCCGSAAG